MSAMQMIFQDPAASLNPRMTVREIIAEGLVIRGVRGKREISEAVVAALERVGLLAEHAERYPHEFSGGQRQRICIARAIVLEPELIIADEPTSALDVSVQAQVINLLNELRRKMGLTLVFISHDLSLVRSFSDRAAVMLRGKIVELAETGELFSRPAHPYTRALLSSIPLPDPYYEKRRQRLIYNPASDRRSGEEQSPLREVFPGHYVSCGTAEYERYAEGR
jgi:ABC-type oligopeptide transport system ATPase subunit